jgi:hypothetical protein
MVHFLRRESARKFIQNNILLVAHFNRIKNHIALKEIGKKDFLSFAFQEAQNGPHRGQRKASEMMAFACLSSFMTHFK